MSSHLMLPGLDYQGSLGARLGHLWCLPLGEIPAQLNHFLPRGEDHMRRPATSQLESGINKERPIRGQH